MTRVSNSVLKIELPAKGNDVTDVKCAKGSISCVVREWTTGSTSVTDLEASCYACDKGNGACTSTESAADVKGVAGYVAANKFTFDQNEVKSTDVLSVRDVTHCPNTKTSVGRFHYKPSTTMPLYSGYSTIAYTFGAQAFGTTSICQVFTSNGNAPSMTHSALVSKCVVSGSTVTVTMAADSTANFHVSIVGMSAWGAAAGKVTGTVTNFGVAV